MPLALRQYTLRKLREPPKDTAEEDIRWICSSLGFVGKRDKNETAFQILSQLVKSAKEESGLTAEQLTQLVTPTIGSVIYHLKRLIKAGLVIKNGSRYELRMRTFQGTIQEIRKEVDLLLDDVTEVARGIDGSR